MPLKMAPPHGAPGGDVKVVADGAVAHVMADSGQLLPEDSHDLRAQRKRVALAKPLRCGGSIFTWFEDLLGKSLGIWWMSK